MKSLGKKRILKGRWAAALLLATLVLLLCSCEFPGATNTVPIPVDPTNNSGNNDTHQHEFTMTVIKEPTCTETGLMRLKCTVCGDEFEEDIPAKGHDMYIKEQSESKCTEESRRVFACRNCDHEVVETLPPAYDDHDYQPEIVTEPSCTQAGLVKYVCSRCGDSYVESISKMPHDFVAQSKTKSVCSECGQVCTYPSNLGFDGVKRLYDEMREALIATTSDKDLSKADKTMGLMWVDYSTYYDSPEESKRGLIIIVRAEYMDPNDSAIIDHERLFPFQLSVSNGQWYFLNPELVELK